MTTVNSLVAVVTMLADALKFDVELVQSVFAMVLCLINSPLEAKIVIVIIFAFFEIINTN